MKNLARLNNYANRLAAWEDWRRIEAEAVATGMADIAAQHRPPETATWRTIDKRIAALRSAMQGAKDDKMTG